MNEEWHEEEDGWDGADRVRVRRYVDMWTRDPKFRRRSVEEFAAALVAATEGLEDTGVDAEEYYESTRVYVSGWRQPTAEERAEHERRGRVEWLYAKGRYEAGREKYEARDV